MMNNIETMKMALEALETLTKEMLTLRDELAERGGRPKASVFHQRLWDSSHEAYVDTAIPAAESLRQAIEQAEQAQPVAFNGWYCAHCQRGVDSSEVTYHEQHTVCGRVITDDLPPAPPPRKPLTDEQFRKIIGSLSRHEGWDGDSWDLALKEAIEAAHQIGVKK